MTKYILTFTTILFYFCYWFTFMTIGDIVIFSHDLKYLNSPTHYLFILLGAIGSYVLKFRFTLKSKT